MTLAPCPCGSGTGFAECCEPYLSGRAPAPTAEKLMRSRFTAFTMGAAEYLLETHHPDARAANELLQLGQSISSTEWLHLMVLGTSKGGPKDSEGIVEFAAAFRAKQPALAGASEPQQMHERAFFVREDGRWLYVDGDRLPPYQPKRNDACWCGSGRKAKACHGA